MERDVPLLFRQLTHGVYVIGVSSGTENNAFTAAWVMQVSFDPLLLAVSIDPQHSSFRMLSESGYFSVNVLSAEDMDLAKHFAQSADTDKLADIGWRYGSTHTPIINNALAYFECNYSHECNAGDHILAFGRVIDGKLLRPGATPMNYRDTGNMDGSSRFYPDELG